MLLLFAGIAVLGLSFFIIGNSRHLITREGSLKSLYLAEAGIQEAIYGYREVGYFPLGESTINPGETYALSGDDAGLLMVDARNTYLDILGDNKTFYLRDLILRGAAEPNNVTIVDMVVTWDDKQTRLKEVNIGGTSVWTGDGRSPTSCSVNTTIVGASDYATFLKFKRKKTGIPAGLNITIRFIMNDGTNKELQVHSPLVGEFNFTVQSQGSVSGVSVSLSAAIEAEYNAAISQIAGYQRIQ